MKHRHFKAHHSHSRNSFGSGNCAAIVDDFIDTGKTVNELIDKTDEYGINVRYILVGTCNGNDDYNEFRYNLEENSLGEPPELIVIEEADDDKSNG